MAGSRKAKKTTRDLDQLRSSLGEIPCLRGVDEQRVDSLARSVRQTVHPKGTLLLRQGEAQGSIHQILSGRVRLFRIAPDGREQNLWVKGAGECFCLSPVDPELQSPFNVECTSETELLVLDPRPTREALGAGSAFDGAVIRCLGERLGDLAHLAESLSGRPVPERLAEALLDLVEREGREVDGGWVLEPITHDEIAATVGTAREVISRTLKRFAAKGLIRAERRRIVVLDRDALADAAGEP